jgi:hypothetical protein
MRGYRHENPRAPNQDRIIFVDGEGQGRSPHIYNFFAGADEKGKIWTLGDDAQRPIATIDWLEFLLFTLPERSLIFAFAFLYDLTKGLTDLDDKALYLLFHEKRRTVIRDGKMFYRPVKWGEFYLNYMNRRFSIRKGNRRATVWDIFAFFQKKFTAACTDWKVANEADLAEMERMKEKRSAFDAQDFAAIKAYCITECKNGASLGRKLIDAHEMAGFPLTSFYGAGSTATALLTKYNVKNYIGVIPDAMKEAVACGFFGGRFENRVIGAIRRPVRAADIASAYPYAATTLPCLTHGHWRFYKGGKAESRIASARLALVNWHLPWIDDPSLPWGVLPVRKADGTIAFPLGARSGWIWKDEFLAAQTLRPDVAVLGAWLYSTDCQCSPFSFLPAVYLERLRIGKDGPGIVLKLGPNSVYGKLVQSVGLNPQFQCWVWGSNITSITRALLLQALALAPDPSNVLMFATDSVWSDCIHTLPKPNDTGTENSYGKPPLGGWEVKDYLRGVFCARPGIYFPLLPTEEDIAIVRARGLGRRALYDAHKTVIAAFQAGERKAVIHGAQRFIGAKSGLSWSASEGVKRSPKYGEWIDWPVEVSFDPRPKRCAIEPNNSLRCWQYFDAPSLPYQNAIRSAEDMLLALAKLIGEEQPAGEFVED